MIDGTVQVGEREKRGLQGPSGLAEHGGRWEMLVSVQVKEGAEGEMDRKLEGQRLWS